MKGPVFFGVRHLSPAAAFQLRKALDQAEQKVAKLYPAADGTPAEAPMEEPE